MPRHRTSESRRCLHWVPLLLGVLCVLSGIAATAEAQARPSRVRSTVLRRIEAVRTPEHRRLYRIDVPRRPRLPAQYEIVLHANYIDRVPGSRAIRISRTARGAHGELIDIDGIHAGPLDAAEVDALALTVFFFASATQQLNNPVLGLGGSGGYASHMPRRAIELRSRSLNASTEYAQPLTIELDEHDDVADFAHAELVERLESYARTHLTAHRRTMTPGVATELRQRLVATPMDRSPLDDYRRQDRETVVARLLAHHLAQTQDRSLLPLFRSRGLLDQARSLDLRSTPTERRTAVLIRALCAADYEEYAPALRFVGELGERGRAAVREALHCVRDPQATMNIIGLLHQPSMRRRDYLRLRALMLSNRGEVQRVAAASRLLSSRSRGRALELLVAVAWRPVSEAMPDAQSRAITALGIDEQRRGSPRAHGERLARLLSTIPLSAHATYSGLTFLVGQLGHFEPARHHAQLVRLLSHSDASLIVRVIETLAEVDQPRALAEIRARVRMYAEGREQSAGYTWEVRPYVPLLIRWRSAEALPELRAVIPRMTTHDVDHRFVPEHRALIRYLAATAADRDAALLELERLRTQ